MQKPILTILFLLTILFKVEGQGYTATIDNVPFSFLENPEIAELDDEDDKWPKFKVPIGFDFNFFDITSDTIYSKPNSFGGFTSLNEDENNLYMLVHFFANFIDRGDAQDSVLSPIHYKTTGTAPNRVFTLEYKEMGFFFGLTDPYGIYEDYISIQVRLIETTGDIEFHVGPYIMNEDPEEVFDVFSGPFIGIMANVQNELGGSIGDVVSISGDLDDPIISDDPFQFMNWPIPENTVFKFSKMTSSTKTIQSSENVGLLYPNPCLNEFNLKADLDFERVEVYNMNGMKVLNSRERRIMTNQLESGTYIVRVYNEGHILNSKLVKLD